MAKVWDCPGVGGGSELLALLALADWSDDEGRCWPSMAAIAKKIRLSRSQSQRIVHQLIADGFLTVIGNNNGGPPGATRQYQINLDLLTGRTHAQDGPHGCGETGRMGATQTTTEPSMNHQGENLCAAGAYATRPDYPDWLLRDLWVDYVDHYRELNEEKGRPVPAAWEAKALRILTDLVTQGHDQKEVLMKAINSDAGMLLPTWLTKNHHRGHTGH